MGKNPPNLRLAKNPTYALSIAHCLVDRLWKSWTSSVHVFAVAVVSGQSCPGGWYHHGTSCYAFIDAEPLGWTEAMVIFFTFI
jgi:hypothetical protein